ncbi:MAG: hypothetical protein WBG11_02210 [Methylocella sp.]
MKDDPKGCNSEREKEKLEIERERLKVEQDKLALEKSFAKKWAAPILGVAGVIVASLFSYVGVSLTNAITEKNYNIENENRRARLKLDLANFLETSLIKEDLTKDDNIKVTKAHAAVISQLFGIGLSKEVVKKVLTLKGLKDEQLNGILGEFNPAQNLTGTYHCFVKCQDYNALASIEQDDTILLITNEVGTKSVGIYETPNQFLVTMPGNLRAFVLDDKIINWANGSVWKR